MEELFDTGKEGVFVIENLQNYSGVEITLESSKKNHWMSEIHFISDNNEAINPEGYFKVMQLVKDVNGKIKH